jgi:hypothetical protein
VQHCIALLDCIDDFPAVHYFAEYCVSSIQVWLGGMGDEELASIRVRSGIRHGDHPCFVLQGISL